MAHDVLIVDDEADIRMLIAGVLKDEGYATREAADTTQSLAAIQARQPTLVILDIWLQGGGLEGRWASPARAFPALERALCSCQLRDDAPRTARDRAVRDRDADRRRAAQGGHI